MPHPQLSTGLNWFMDTLVQILFETMQIGETLLVRAIDAKTKQENEFTLRFLGFRDNDRQDSAILSFSADGFSFYATDRKTPITIPSGTIALSGTAQKHLPVPINCLVGTGGIHVNRDYSFESIGGGLESLYVENVVWLTRLPAPEGWVIPKEEILNFFSRLAEVTRRVEQKVTVKTTSGNVYHLSETDAAGLRMVQSSQHPTPIRGRISCVHPGIPMCFFPINEEDKLHTFRSSPVVEVIFDSEG